MNPQDPLASLHPLREPLAIGWWPPAPGWWLLTAILFLLAIIGVYLTWQRYRANAYRRLAQQQLAGIEAQYERDGDSAYVAGQLNALLKSTALRCYPRQDVAALNGERWREFLNETAGTTDTPLFYQDFEQIVYRAQSQTSETEQLLAATRTWIAQHRKRT